MTSVIGRLSKKQTKTSSSEKRKNEEKKEEEEDGNDSQTGWLNCRTAKPPDRPTRCAAYTGGGKQAASDKINTIPTDLSETARTHHDREKRQRLEQKTLCAQTAEARAAQTGKRRELVIYNKSQETSWLAAGGWGWGFEGVRVRGSNRANDTSKARGMFS